MVAIIKSGYSIRSTLTYHENKVKAGSAECIEAGNYPVDPDKMSFTMKGKQYCANAIQERCVFNPNFEPWSQ